MRTFAIILALVATLAAAAPVSDSSGSREIEARSSDEAIIRDGPDDTELAARGSPGMSVRCFQKAGCTGPEAGQTYTKYDYPPNSWTSFPYKVPRNVPFSCRLDTWDGWAGQMYLIRGGRDNPFEGERISGIISSSGAGQSCIDLAESAMYYPYETSVVAAIAHRY